MLPLIHQNSSISSVEGFSDDCQSVCFVENLEGFAHPLCSIAMWGQGTAHCHGSFQTHLSAGRKTGKISP